MVGVAVTAPAVLDVHDLRVSYAGAVKALRGVSLSVPEGAVVAVLGNNGAGKSTLLRALSGTLPAQGGAITGGTIQFRGRALPRDDAASIARGGLVQVPEGRRVFSNLTVEENLRAGALASPDKAARAEARAWVDELFPILRERASQRAGSAERRRAADARHRPRADGLAQGAAARRAVARAGAEDRRAGRRGHPRDQRARRDRRAGRAERGDGAVGRRPRGRARGRRGRAAKAPPTSWPRARRSRSATSASRSRHRDARSASRAPRSRSTVAGPVRALRRARRARATSPSPSSPARCTR